MNKLFLIILSAFLLLPVNLSWAVEADSFDDGISSKETQIVEDVETDTPDGLLQEEVPVVEESSENEVADEPVPYKQPVSKRSLAKKFLAAMGGVAASSFALFFILTLYNKAREKYLNPIKTPEGESSLETPDDLNSAVKTFLEKTKWE